MILPQRRGQIGRCVVHQGHQPADHLQGAAMESRSLSVWTLFVVTTRHRIQAKIMDADAEALLLVLPSPEDRQDVLRFALGRGVQRVPAILLRSGPNLPADDGANRL